MSLPDQLTEAARQHDAESCSSLLALGVDMNACDSSGVSPLIAASEQGATAIVKFLLVSRASGAYGKRAEPCCTQWTPLCLQGNGAKANLVSSSGNTALRAAILGGENECVQILLGKDASVH